MGRKIELERRIELLQGEREGLSSTLDESADRIIMLEKQTREQDSIVMISRLHMLICQLIRARYLKKRTRHSCHVGRLLYISEFQCPV